MADVMYDNISEKKLLYFNKILCFTQEFATAESRGSFMRKLRFVVDKIQAI